MGKIKNFVNHMSVGQKVMMVIIVEIVSYTMVTMIALSQINAVGIEVKQMADLYLPLFSSTETARQQIQDMRLNLKEIIFVGDRVVYDMDSEEKYLSEKAQYVRKNEQIGDQISWAENLITAATSDRVGRYSVIRQHSEKLLLQLASIREGIRIHSKRVEKLFIHVEEGSFLMGMEMIDDVNESEANLNEKLDKLIEILFVLKGASVEYASQVEARASYFTISASLLTVCIVITIFFFVVKKNITQPFFVLIDTINSFDALHESQDTRPEKHMMTRGDELGTVARSFNNLKHVVWDQRRDLQLAKEEAERANRAKSQFLAAASHDLRQPMHAMQMFIAALRERVNDKEALSILSNIDAVSVSSGRLLNSLLDVSQLEAGDVHPQFESFPVQEVLRRVSRSFIGMAQSKGLEFRVIPSSFIVHSDPILLERILLNFVSNAIRYTAKGRVLIGCRRRGRQVSIEVLDTGPGIPQEQSEAIYEDFHQLNNPERDRSRGLGLGLAIVRRLNACLNHHVEHHSIIGQGSCFSIRLAMGDPQNVSRVGVDGDSESESDAIANLVGVRVLVIEDDSSVLDATCILLESWKLEAMAAKSTAEALKLVTEKSAKPEFIIADFRLPDGSDGVDAITKIQLLLGEAIPSLVITGDIETGRENVISELGYRVLKKPVRPAKLRRLMTHLLSQHRRSSISYEALSD